MENIINVSPYVIPGLKLRIEFIASGSDRTNIQSVIDLIVAETDYSVKDILSKKREHGLTQVRFVCMWVLRNKLKLPYRVIASFFKKDHSTIIYGVKLINDRLYIKDEKTTSIIEHIKHFI